MTPHTDAAFWADMQARLRRIEADCKAVALSATDPSGIWAARHIALVTSGLAISAQIALTDARADAPAEKAA